jgi:hypothetical protein
MFYLDVATLLLLQAENIDQVLDHHVLLRCSYITATANECGPNLGPLCSYWDVAALLFNENKEDKPTIKKAGKLLKTF